jgi:DNA-binding response OmpR family regulator
MEPWHILSIEDDPAVAKALQEGLRREGYRVSSCATAQQGITSAQAHQPHLILLDVRLPDLSGFDTLRRLRATGLKQPVLMLTVQSEEVDKVLGLELGADDYLAKPYSLRELLARVRALLRRSYGELSSNDGDLLYTSDLRIDRRRTQVWRGNEALNLTPTEFKLLVYLVRNATYALTREQIITEVWGGGNDLEDERTINVHIRRLREKIELDPSKPSLILTVPGVGYRFVG